MPCSSCFAPAVSDALEDSASTVAARVPAANTRAVAKNTRKRMGLTNRILRQNEFQRDTSSRCKKGRLFAGSPETLHHREKFHKRFLKKINPAARTRRSS